MSAALFEAARAGDVETLTRELDARPDDLHAREDPYAWTLLHAAAERGQLAVVDLLLARGLDPNERERGDRSYAMHWAAAGGHVEVVRRLADAGGDVIGEDDDHALQVIGWATCWPGCQDSHHFAVANLLLERGARHHMFSAIACDLEDEVRRIVAGDPQSINRRMSRNENHRTPLQYAVGMARPRMVGLLVELGADPLAVDDAGMPVAAYATTPDVDRPAMEAIRAMTLAELDSAARGQRPVRVSPPDLLAALALGDQDLAGRLVSAHAELLDGDAGVLNMMTKRGDAAAVRWLLVHGADPNELWKDGGVTVTPLHLAARFDRADLARTLLEAGADPRIRDSEHDGNPADWAQFFGHAELAALLRTAAAAPELHPDAGQ